MNVGMQFVGLAAGTAPLTLQNPNLPLNSNLCIPLRIEKKAGLCEN